MCLAHSYLALQHRAQFFYRAGEHCYHFSSCSLRRSVKHERCYISVLQARHRRLERAFLLTVDCVEKVMDLRTADEIALSKIASAAAIGLDWCLQWCSGDFMRDWPSEFERAALASVRAENHLQVSRTFSFTAKRINNLSFWRLQSRERGSSDGEKMWMAFIRNL